MLLSGKHPLDSSAARTGVPTGNDLRPRLRHPLTRAGRVLICDAKTGEAVLPPLQCEYEPGSLAWSPDGSILAVGLERDGPTVIGHPRDGSYSSRPAPASNSPPRPDLDVEWGVAWSPDGKRLAAAGERILRVWDSALHPQPFAAATPDAWCLDWSPDGKRLARGKQDGTITIYDAATGTPLHVLRGHGTSRRFSGTPGCHGSPPEAGTEMIRIWDSSTGQELCALQTHNCIVRDLDWSPDGWRLASTGGDGSVRIWDASPADRFLKRHEDLRERVWTLVRRYWTATRGRREGVPGGPRPAQAAPRLHPEEKDLKWQTQCVEWFRATQLARAGQTDEAIALFRRLTAEAPDLPDYRLVLPGELFDAGKETQAIAMLEKWVAEFPQRPEYHEELAFLYERRAIQLCQSGELPARGCHPPQAGQGVSRETRASARRWCGC